MDGYAYDKELIKAGYPLLAGVDEAGRGPLAGPVVAAAVILDVSRPIEGLADSKKLSAARREVLFEEILQQAAQVQVVSFSPEDIDRLNILQATLQAMAQAVQQLTPVPDLVLIDGNQLPELAVPSLAVVKGDSLSASIAAASIIAKVTRDRTMVELAKAYPEFEFERHKGYPTKLHYQRLDEYGPSPIHRQSFLKKWRARHEK